jgi:hypothetical protein
MALEDKIEAVKKVNKALKDKSSEPEIERIPPNKEHFDSLMSTERSKDAVQTQQIQKVEETTKTEKVSAPSMMDQVKNLNNKINNIAKLSPEDLKNQIHDIISQMDQVKEELASSGDIRPSYKTLMHNRLTHIDDNIKIALSKAGVEFNTEEAASLIGHNTNTNTQLTPLDRFLGLITHGQYQLEHLSTTVAELSKKGKSVTPIEMMGLQIKVGQIQQEIELFTSLLNKALESTKTLMNVQV